MATNDPIHITVTAKDPTVNPVRYYLVGLTLRDVSRYDNYHLVSIGLVVGEERFKPASLRRLELDGRVKEVSQDVWNHSGCQSGCVKRGGSQCRW